MIFLYFRTLNAFLNSNVKGTVYLGVTDEGIVKGIPVSEHQVSIMLKHQQQNNNLAGHHLVKCIRNNKDGYTIYEFIRCFGHLNSYVISLGIGGNAGSDFNCSKIHDDYLSKSLFASPFAKITITYELHG